MVKERGVVDKEAGVSMRSWGWSAYKKRDAIYCPRCHALVLPSGEAGTFDFPKVGVVSMGLGKVIYIDVEVKAGNTAFAFSEFDEEKRIWAETTKERQKFIWLCIGRSLRDDKKPRRTYLIPLELFYTLESGLDRLSIPYGCETLAPYELEWCGNSVWKLYDGLLETIEAKDAITREEAPPEKSEQQK